MTKEHAYAYEVGYKDGYAARDGEIVRCRDCKYYDGEPDMESMDENCWRDPNHTGRSAPTVADGYCWRGERREQ